MWQYTTEHVFFWQTPSENIIRCIYLCDSLNQGKGGGEILKDKYYIVSLGVFVRIATKDTKMSFG
jgi:hypothetical protein